MHAKIMKSTGNILKHNSQRTKSEIYGPQIRISPVLWDVEFACMWLGVINMLFLLFF